MRMKTALSSTALIMLAALGLPGCDDGESPTGDDAKTATANGDPSAATGSGKFGAVQVAVDQKISFARMSDGTVRAWGINDHRMLGKLKKKEQDTATPVKVPGLADVVDIETGGNTGAQVACARISGGKVKCWGAANSPLPLEKLKALDEPTEIPALEGATQLSLSTNGHGCAVMKDKTAKCWGYNAFGVLGLGEQKAKQHGPTKVPGLTKVAEIVAGYNHTCARLEDGAVHCWGYNSSHTVHPTNKDDKIHSPMATGVTGAKKLALGSGFSCALTDKGVTCWGSGYYQGPKEVEGVSNVVDVRANGGTMCMLEQGGTLKCKGSNEYGQLGDGSTKRAKGVVTPKGLKNVASFDVGERHACAALTDRSVMCWGYNQRGEIGDGTLQNRFAPVAVKHIADKKLPAPNNGFGDVHEGSVEQSFGGLPAACKRDAKLAVTYPHLSGMSKLDVVSAYAIRSNDKSLELRFANYNIDPKNFYRNEPRAEQLRYTIGFYHIDLDKKRERKPLVVGKYDMGTDHDRYMVPHVKSRAHGYTIASIGLGGVSGGSVEISYLGNDWVCGKLAIKSKKNALSGHFAAKVIKP